MMQNTHTANDEVPEKYVRRVVVSSNINDK